VSGTPVTHYTKSGPFHIAYQVTEPRPLDLMLFPDGMIPMEAIWELPAFRRFVDRLAGFARVICLDRRGFGFSDPLTPEHPPTLEQWAGDAVAVMDAAQAVAVAILGMAEGGFVASYLAAAYPERVSRLVLIHATPSFTAEPFREWGGATAALERLEGTVEEAWGEVDFGIPLFAPSAVDDPEYRDWLKRAIRRSLSPAMARAVFEVLFLSDIQGILGAIRVPTLVVHRKGNSYVPVEHGRYLAEHIPEALLVEVEGPDHVPYLGDSEPIIAAVGEFLTGQKALAMPNRFLTTLLFTDIVGSTQVAARLGDSRWQELLTEHDRLVHQQLARHGGTEMAHTGDGFVATFDGPARAIRCAEAIAPAVRRLGLEVRSGIHTGECELVDGQLTGIAVHIAARVVARAGPGEILVSSTVKDLVAGSGLSFSDQGYHQLKGVPDSWRLFSVDQDEDLVSA
jgi:class 3 adenylate cyclase